MRRTPTLAFLLVTIGIDMLDLGLVAPVGDYLVQGVANSV
jgi:hypothetical protein